MQNGQLKLLFTCFFFLFFFQLSFNAQTIKLTSSPQYVKVGDLDITGNKITVEALVKFTGGVNIVSKHTGPPNVNYLMRIGTFEITTTQQFYLMSNPYASSMLPNVWYHVAGTYDGSFIRYYVNGCLIVENAATGNIVTNNLITGIGNISSAPNSEQFYGEIDELRIWNVARSAVELSTNMFDLANPTTQSGLKGYWKFDGNLTNLQGTVAHNGTWVGTASYGVQPSSSVIPTFGIQSVTSSNLTCFEAGNGSIAVTAQGTNVNFSIDGTNWSTTNTFTNLSANNYTVYARTQEGCVQAQTNVILTQPSEITASSSNSGPYCSGNPITLNGSSTTPGVSYGWTGPGGYTSSVQNPTDATLGGVYQLTTSLGGCSSSVKPTNVVVNTTPSASATNTGAYCVGDALVLQGSSTSAGVSYAWTGPGGYTSSAQNPTNATVAGDYFLTTTLNGCVSQTATTTVSISAIPTASASNTGAYCDGDAILLEGSSTTPGVTYAWSGPGGFTSTNQNPTTATAAGTYQLTTSLNGCEKQTTTLVVVKTRPSAIASNTGAYCQGEAVSLASSSTTAGVSYAWTGPNGFTSSDQNPTNATNAGVYQLVISLNGCDSPTQSTTVVINEIPTASAGNSGPYCQGDVISLTGSSTTAGVSYAWTGPNGFTSSSQNPANATLSGNYQLITSLNGCSSSAQNTTILISPRPTADANNIGTYCNNDPILLYGSSTNAGVSYAWTGPVGFTSTDQNPTNATLAGNYQLITTLNGCTSLADITTVTINTSPSVTANNTGPYCQGSAITLQGSSSSAGVSYAWTGPSGFTSNIKNPTNATLPGDYVLITTLNGCPSSAATTTVVINPKPTASASNTGPYCQGDIITLEGSSTNAGVTYAWTGPGGFTSSDQNPTTPVLAGTYQLKTSLNGCTSLTQNTIVVINGIPTASATNTGAYCQGSAITLQGSSSSSSVSYAWTGPSGFTSSVKNPTTATLPGDYILTTTLNGCSSLAATTTVVIKPKPTASASNTGAYCQGATISLQGSSTDAGVGYAWTGPSGYTSTNQNPTNATMAGNYQLITSLNGCTSVAQITTVVINPIPSASASNTGAYCQGGAISLQGSSTNPGVTYAWTGPSGFSSTNQNPSNATLAGSYQLVTSLNGCSSLPQTTTVVINPIPTATATNTGAYCQGSTITLQGSSTNAGVAYAWTGPSAYTSTVKNPTNATLPGDYVLTTTLNGCSSLVSTTTVVINPKPTASASNTGPYCQGDLITLEGSSTNIGVTYAWTGPGGFTSTDQNPTTPVLAGTYQLKTSLDGCTSLVQSTLVVIKVVPTANATNTGAYCQGSTITLQGSSTSSSASYAWTGPNGFTSSVKNPTTATLPGDYILTTTLNGCSSLVATTTVVVKPKPTASASNTGAYCQGAAISLQGSSTDAGVGYAWTGPGGFSSTNQNPSNATLPGNYQLITSLNGCTSIAQITTVVINVIPTASASNTGAYCQGSVITLQGSSTNTGVSYTWTGPGGFTSSAKNPTNATVAGTYQLVTSLNGCSSLAQTTTVVINVIPTATASNTGTYCQGSAISLLGSSTNPGVTYAWTGPSGFTSTIQNPTNATLAGNYQLITSLNGCNSLAQTTTVEIIVTPSAIASNTGSYCQGDAISLQGSSTNTGVSYAWTGPNGFTSTNQNPTNATLAGVYQLITSISGCTSLAQTTTVVINVIPTASASNTGAYCQGDAISLEGSSTNTGVSYAWTGPSGFTSTNQNPTTATLAGNYQLITSLNGCNSLAQTTTVVINVIPTATASNTGDYCQGDAISLQGSSTNTGVSFAWTGPSGFTSTNQNPSTATVAGNYQLITSLNGCNSLAQTTTVVINVIPTAAASNTGAYCQGDAISLEGSSTNTGVSYAWTGPSGFTSTTQNPTTATLAGNYQLITSLNGCNSLAETTTVVINVIPTASASNTGAYCQGDAISLEGLSTNTGVSFAWTGPNGFTSSTQNPTNATDAGDYQLITSLNGCNSLAETTTVVINVIPTASASNTGAYCQGVAISLEGASTNTGVSFSWTGPNGFTSTDQNPTTATDAGDYLLITSLNGCDSPSETTTVVINVIPTASASNTGAYCQGDAISLEGSSTNAGVSFAWTGPNGFTSTTQNPSTATDAGEYQLITSLNGCNSLSQATTVVINVIPTASATNTGAYCQGDAITLEGSSTNTGVSFAWTGPNGFASTDQNPSTATESGDYQLITSLNGCISLTETTTVVINVIPTASATNTGAYCQGDAISLQGSSTNAGVSYAWTGPNGFTSTTQNPTNATAAGDYQLITSLNGCSSTSISTTVIINALPTVSASNTGPYCENESILLQSTSPTSGVSYAWSGPNGFSSTSQNPTTATVSGTYQVIVSDNFCSSLLASTTVIIKLTPVATATNAGPFCFGSTALLNGQSNPATNAVFAWTGPTGFSSTLQNPMTTQSGNYSLIVTVDGCSSLTSSTTVVFAEDFSANASNSGPYYYGETIELFSSSNLAGTYSYSWETGGNVVSTNQNPTFPATNQTTTYTVTLSSPFGCDASATTIVLYGLPALVIVPNVFTPNNDGVNDVFEFQLKGVVSVRCQIYNRWGNLIHEMDGASPIWDGNANNNQTVSAGVYFYKVEAVDYDGNVIVKQGNVEVLY